MTYYFFSMVPKVLLEAFDGIFYAHFLKNKLEIWGKAQRESAQRPKSDWGKLGE